jgi:hypothetical protein
MSIFKRFPRKVDPARSAGVEVPFRVGGRVRDTWGNCHTIMEVDPKAEHGLGMIRTRRESDGVELGSAVIAHGLTLVSRKDQT